MNAAKPRCLMLLDNAYRPDQRPKREIATLASAGWDVVLICEQAPGLPDVTRQDGAEVRRIRAPWRGSLLSFGARSRLAEFIDLVRGQWPDGFDVVHCHDWLTLPVGARVAKAIGARLVYDSHEYFAGMTHPGKRIGLRAAMRRWFRQRQEGSALRRVSLLITVSPMIGEWFRSRRGYKGRIAILRNMPDWTAMPQPDPTLRLRLGLPAGARLFVHGGNIRFDSRRIDIVVKALADVKDCHLLCVGEGEKERLLQVAAEFGVRERVHYIDAVPNSQLGGLLAACDIGLSVLQPGVPNHEAALPNKLFEYLLAGLPVLGSPIQAQSQFLEEEGVGWTMGDLTPSACAQALRRATDEFGTVRERVMGQRERYGWPSQEAELVSAYSGLRG